MTGLCQHALRGKIARAGKVHGPGFAPATSQVIVKLVAPTGTSMNPYTHESPDDRGNAVGYAWHNNRLQAVYGSRVT